VVARSRRVQGELDALIADVASLHDEVAGAVRIGVIGTTARWLVPRLMTLMTERHPKVHVVIVDATTSSLIPQLESGALDLAVVNMPIGDPDITADPLFDEDHVLIAPVGHGFFERDELELSELDRVPLLLEPQGTGFRDHLDEEARAAGITLVPLAEVDGMRLLASLAFQGFGPGVVPASAAPFRENDDWQRVRVNGLQRRAVGLARRKRGLLSAPARAFRDVLIEVVRLDGTTEPGIHPTLP
jgi:DNA-binding transcriptional LysR family regulator